MKSGRLTPPDPFFFLKTALALQGLLCFHIKCEIFCPSSVKNAIGNLIGITLNLWITFGSIVIFKILILPTQEHVISLHLFMLPLISFISPVQFSRSVVSDSLQPHELQHARPPRPSETPRVYSNSCP